MTGLLICGSVLSAYALLILFFRHWLFTRRT